MYRVEAREVCILNVGHSRSRARASYPSCITAYPRGSRSRVFDWWGASRARVKSEALELRSQSAALDNPTPSANDISDFRLPIFDLAQKKPRDEKRAKQPQNRRENNIRQVVGSNVHARKGD